MGQEGAHGRSILKRSEETSGTLGKLSLQHPTLSCCLKQGKVLMVVDHEGAQRGHGSTSPHSAPWTGSQSLWNPCSIPKSPDPKELPEAAGDSSTEGNAPKLSAGHSGLGLSCSCHLGPRWAPALRTAPPPRCSPKPQSAGRCLEEARRGAPLQPAASGCEAGGWLGSPGGQRLRVPPRKWPSPSGDSPAAAEPGS